MKIRSFAMAVYPLCFSPMALAESPPALPDSAVLQATGSMFVSEYSIWLQVDIYIDESGVKPMVWKIYRLRGQKRVVRITWSESFGDELTVWPKDGFE